MPSWGVRYKLLGGQLEYLNGVIIDVRHERALELRGIAKSRYEQWAASPDDGHARHAYAAALQQYARQIGDKDMLAHAFRLLTQQGGGKGDERG